MTTKYTREHIRKLHNELAQTARAMSICTCEVFEPGAWHDILCICICKNCGGLVTLDMIMTYLNTPWMAKVREEKEKKSESGNQ